MEENTTVLKRPFALVENRKENTVVLRDVEARVIKIPAEVISSSNEAVVFQTKRRFINNKEQMECEADSLVTLHEVDPEDKNPIDINDLYDDDASSIDSGSTEPNPDLQVLQIDYPSDERTVFPLPPGLSDNECSAKIEQTYAPPNFSPKRGGVSAKQEEPH